MFSKSSSKGIAVGSWTECLPAQNPNAASASRIIKSLLWSMNFATGSACLTTRDPETQVVVGIGRAIRVARNRLGVGLDGLVHVAARLEQDREIVVRDRILRVALHGTPIVHLGFTELPGLVLEPSEVQVRVRQ